MLALVDATAQASCFYFVFIILIGTLFLMNYTVAMMCIAYVEVIFDRSNTPKCLLL